MTEDIFSANDCVPVSEDNEVLMWEILCLNCKPFEGSFSSGKVVFFVLKEEKLKFLRVCKSLKIKPVWKNSFAHVSAEKCFWAIDGDDTTRWFIW